MCQEADDLDDDDWNEDDLIGMTNGSSHRRKK